ncbi:MAG TPA: hypothetical protein VN680_15740 [Burkholderiaceae bacterium]|jgi:hypothetical protein|nr:hypothetical protein [Burkholderiaceae bacterium]
MKLEHRVTASTVLWMGVAVVLTIAEVASVDYIAQYRTTARNMPVVHMDRVVVTAQRNVSPTVALLNADEHRPNRAGA